MGFQAPESYWESFQQYIKEQLRKLTTLASASNVSIPANGGTVTLPSDEGIDVSMYKEKAIEALADHEMHLVVQISEDRVTWNDCLPFTVLKNKVRMEPIDGSVRYVRVVAINPDYFSDHKITVRFRGRGL